MKFPQEPFIAKQLKVIEAKKKEKESNKKAKK